MPCPLLATLDFTARTHTVPPACPVCCGLSHAPLAFRGSFLNMVCFSLQCQGSLVPWPDGTPTVLCVPDIVWEPRPFFF